VKKFIIIHILLTVILTGNAFSENLKHIQVEGIEDKEIITLIVSNIKVSLNKYNDISSYNSISKEYRIINDIKIIKTILKSFGYFEAKVNSSIKGEVFFIKINPGERYRFNDLSLEYADDSSYFSGIKVREVFNLMEIKQNDYVSMKKITEAMEKLHKFYKNRGFVFVKIGTPKLVVNRERKTFKAVFEIVLGKKVIIMGTKIIIKNKKLENFIRNRVLWKKGDIYKEDVCERTKDHLKDYNIFSSVDIEVDDDGFLVITAEEAKPRSIQAGVNYSTIEGVGASFSWIHYNIDDKGSSFSTTTTFSKRIQSEKLRYNMHDLLRRGDELKNQLYYTVENTESYKLKKAAGESMVWNRVSRFKNTNFGIGMSAENSRTDDKIEDEPIEKYESFNAIGIPLGLNIDNTDDYLSPHSGTRAMVSVTPYISTKRITNLNGKFSFYFPFQVRDMYNSDVIVACYIKSGCIIHSGTEKLPRDKLFFGGGSDSVRGYSYQMLGDLDEKNKPLGGGSILEFGIEPRFMVTEKIEAVVFIEGGNVFNTKNPFGKKLMYSGGIGVRYYTPLGPIRLDVAFPFNRRLSASGKFIDSFLNIYLSIGQAF
jgi:translocation and assembly module TamA